MFNFLQSTKADHPTVMRDTSASDLKAAQLELKKQASENITLRASLDNVTTALMMVDRDLIVTYVNEATKTLLAENESVFQSVFDGFDAANIIGTCVDVFHTNPAHQRALLNDLSKLPWKTDIKSRT